ncbi:hypothetical protein H632_c515p0, partial [Helicosporidium sp. ATCC 50920]
MTEPPATNHPVEAEDQEEATTPASPDVPAEALGAGIADRVAVKFLIPNVAAGSIIGKGGANISGMQAQSNARMQRRGRGAAWLGLECFLAMEVAFAADPRPDPPPIREATVAVFTKPLRPWNAAYFYECIAFFLACGLFVWDEDWRLSKSNEFYPGSMDGQDRILLLSGSREQLLTALHLVLMRFQGESSSPALRAVTAKDGENVVLRVLVHSRLCGTLIGKGGATIRSFNENSGATFNISPPPTLPGLTERIVKITGNVDQIMRAVALVVTKLAENPDFHLLTDANLTYASRGYGAYAPPGMLGMLGGAGAIQAAPGIHL